MDEDEKEEDHDPRCWVQPEVTRDGGGDTCKTAVSLAGSSRLIRYRLRESLQMDVRATRRPQDPGEKPPNQVVRVSQLGLVHLLSSGGHISLPMLGV